MAIMGINHMTVKAFTFLLFSLFTFTTLSSYSQNDSATTIKNSAKDTSSASEQKLSSTSKYARENIKLNSQSVKISRPFYINTIISPTDSLAENRVIKILGDDLVANGFLFEVKNRWGNPIYESQSLTQMTTIGWDGKKDEEIIPLGLYSFIVRYQNNNGESFQKVGFITVQ